MARWASVPGFEGYYEVSDTGRVRSLDRVIHKPYRSGKIIKALLEGRELQQVAANGQGSHRAVALSRDGVVTKHLVHRLMLLAFIGPPPNDKSECCHYDGNDRNNRLSNLRWGSHADNAADSARHGLKKGTRHHGAKLDNRKVRSIRLRYAAGEGMTALAEQYGVTHTTIGRVVRRSGWGHIP